MCCTKKYIHCWQWYANFTLIYRKFDNLFYILTQIKIGQKGNWKIKHCDQDICHGQINDEAIRHRSHCPIPENYGDHHQVSEQSTEKHNTISNRVDCDHICRLFQNEELLFSIVSHATIRILGCQNTERRRSRSHNGNNRSLGLQETKQNFLVENILFKVDNKRIELVPLRLTFTPCINWTQSGNLMIDAAAMALF